MHYLQLFITKHNKTHDIEKIKIDARQEISNFLKPYYETKWDYYTFGGRWQDLFGGESTVPYKRALSKLENMLEQRDEKIANDREKILDAVNGDTNDDDDMNGYYIKTFGELLGRYYTDQPLFYNLHEYSAFELLDKKQDENEFFVTIVDLHN